MVIPTSMKNTQLPEGYYTIFMGEKDNDLPLPSSSEDCSTWVY